MSAETKTKDVLAEVAEIAARVGAEERAKLAEAEGKIAAARKFARKLDRSTKTLIDLVTANADMAARCRYTLPRRGEDGKPISGPSIVFAEAVFHAWGNLEIVGRIERVDDTQVVLCGIAIDHESNNRISVEVARSIMAGGKTGQPRRYSDSMIATTCQAGIAIAIRNAILRVVPAIFWEPAYEAAIKAAGGDEKTLDERRALAVQTCAARGISADRVFAALEVGGLVEITSAKLADLRAMLESLKEPGASIDDVFPEVKPRGKPKTEPQPASDIPASIG